MPPQKDFLRINTHQNEARIVKQGLEDIWERDKPRNKVFVHMFLY